MINIVVCVKQVYDPEAPASTFRIDAEAKRALPPKGSPPALSPFDANALEAALKIKDQHEAAVTVLSLGGSLAKPVLQQTLASGADELIMLQDEVFDGLDGFATAQVLAAAIRKLEAVDLVLCGRQAADTNAGVVGPLLAEILALPCIAVGRRIEAVDGRIKVERETKDGYEIVAAPLPALVTASSEIGELRLATVKATMMARKKKVPVWRAADLDLDPASLRRLELIDLKLAPGRGGKCILVEAGSAQEAGRQLAEKLAQDNII